MMMRRLGWFLLFFLLLISAYGEIFQFKYSLGDKYRYISRVQEEIFWDGRFNNYAELLYRVAIETVKTEKGSGQIAARYNVYSKKRGASGVFSESGQEYLSSYWIDQQGRLDIAPGYHMPVLRNVPFFPAKELAVGEVWSAPGEEVHDFLMELDMEEPVRFPVTVVYTYLGKEPYPGDNSGNRYHKIAIEYTIFYKPPKPEQPHPYFTELITGQVKQTLYWDNELGRPYGVFDNFDIIFNFLNGGSFEGKGTGETKMVLAADMDKKALTREIQEKIRDQQVEDAQVSEDEKGVKITLENIQFLPDSAVLQATEIKKLKRIAAILKDYPDRDLLIIGHTALAGSEAGRSRLSVERAQAVGNFLLTSRARKEEQITIRGVGASQPVADNSTEQGMRKNRRVEIIILEN